MHKMDSEILQSFMVLNKKIDNHYQLIDKMIDRHSLKIGKICGYIERQQEEKETKKEESNRKFYIAMAIIGVGFGLFKAIESMGFW